MLLTFFYYYINALSIESELNTIIHSLNGSKNYGIEIINKKDQVNSLGKRKYFFIVENTDSKIRKVHLKRKDILIEDLTSQTFSDSSEYEGSLMETSVSQTFSDSSEYEGSLMEISVSQTFSDSSEYEENQREVSKIQVFPDGINDIFDQITRLCKKRETPESLLKLEEKIAQLGSFFITLIHKEPHNLLWQSYESNNFNTFNLLLKKGANPNHIGENLSTLLLQALFYGRLEFIFSLIQNGAQLDQLGNIGAPFSYLVAPSNQLVDTLCKAESFRFGMICYFLAKGVHPDTLSIVFHPFSIEKARMVHEFYFDVTEMEFRLPLALAMQRGEKRIISLLISRGANINYKDYYGNNALHDLLKDREGDLCDELLEIFKFLVNKGVDLLSPNFHLFTPIEYFHLSIVQIVQKEKIYGKNIAVGQIYKFEETILNEIKVSPLIQALSTFQIHFPLPYDRDMGVSTILWTMRDIVLNKIIQERPYAKHFIASYLKIKLGNQLHLRRFDKKQTVPLDMPFLFAYALKDHSHPVVSQFAREILAMLLQKNSRHQFIFKEHLTPSAQIYLLFFSEKQHPSCHLSLHFQNMYQSLLNKEPFLLPWVLLMNEKEALEFTRYCFRLNYRNPIYHPFKFALNMTTCALQRFSFLRLASQLSTKVDSFNQMIQKEQINTDSMILKETELEELFDKVSLEEKIPTFHSPLLRDSQWVSHGRSLVLKVSDSPYLEVIIKFKKKTESVSSFDDYQVLKICRLNGGWKHLKPIQKVYISSPLIQKIQDFLNTNQQDSDETFELDGHAILLLSSSPYFIYLHQIKDKEEFLKALQTNIRQTLSLYPTGYIRNEMTNSQHDDQGLVLRRSLYYLPGWGITFWMHNKGIVSNRHSFLQLSNFGKNIRDPGNYFKKNDWTSKKQQQLIESNFLYSHPEKDILNNLICDALIEVLDIAFEHYLYFYSHHTSNREEKVMVQEIRDHIIRPILEANCPFIEPYLWDGLLEEFIEEIQADVRLFIDNPQYIEQVFLRLNSRENYLQNIIRVIIQCYTLIGAYLNEPEELRDLLLSKNKQVTCLNKNSSLPLENEQEQIFLSFTCFEERLSFFRNNFCIHEKSDSHSINEFIKYLTFMFLENHKEECLQVIRQLNIRHPQILSELFVIFYYTNDMDGLSFLLDCSVDILDDNYFPIIKDILGQILSTYPHRNEQSWNFFLFVTNTIPLEKQKKIFEKISASTRIKIIFAMCKHNLFERAHQFIDQYIQSSTPYVDCSILFHFPQIDDFTLEKLLLVYEKIYGSVENLSVNWMEIIENNQSHIFEVLLKNKKVQELISISFLIDQIIKNDRDYLFFILYSEQPQQLLEELKKQQQKDFQSSVYKSLFEKDAICVLTKSIELRVPLLPSDLYHRNFILEQCLYYKSWRFLNFFQQQYFSKVKSETVPLIERSHLNNILNEGFYA